jgi:hypothetical protein
LIRHPASFADTPLPQWVTCMDVLSEVLKAVKLDGALFYNGEFSAPWCAHEPDSRTMASYLSTTSKHVIIFHLLTEGRGYARVAGDNRPVPLTAGDIVVFPRGDAHIMGNGSPVAPMDNAGEMKLLAASCGVSQHSHIRSGRRSSCGCPGRCTDRSTISPFARSPPVATSYPSVQHSPPHRSCFPAGFRRKISRAVMRLKICPLRPGATSGCARRQRRGMCFWSVPRAALAIGNRSAISTAVSRIIVVTPSSSSAFRSFTGNTNRVVDLPRPVRSLSHGLLPLVRPAPEGTRKDCTP